VTDLECYTFSHHIRTDEFCAYFKLEEDAIAVKMVNSMHTLEKRCLNFCEMVGLVWDFLSRDPRSLGSFAFYLFDNNKNGCLCREEVTELVESLHHTTAAKHKGVSKIVSDMIGNEVEIDVSDFHKYCKKHDEVCLLLFGLQTSLRERILGTPFWKAISKRRCNNEEQMDANYIRDLYCEWKATREARLKAQEEADLLHATSRAEQRQAAPGPAMEKKRHNALFNFFVSLVCAFHASPLLSFSHVCVLS
jgi:Ca2+-binding EF-hand superfamily protein